jgi:hypothetical protein
MRRSILLFALIAQSVWAQSDSLTAQVGRATYHFQSRQFAPVFKDTLIFGHTLSADFLIGIVSQSKSPGTILSTVYAHSQPVANISEPRSLAVLDFSSVDPLDAMEKKKDLCAELDREEQGFAQIRFHGPGAEDLRTACRHLNEESFTETEWRHIRSWVPAGISLETGKDKMIRLLNQVDDGETGERSLSYLNQVYARASSLVGIDAFYMLATSTFQNWQDTDLQLTLNYFTRKIAQDHKVLILGTVPKDKYNQFSIPYRLSVPTQLEDRRQFINRALRSECLQERNCYLVDIEAMVNELNTTGHLYLKDGTQLDRDLSQTKRKTGVLTFAHPDLLVRPDGLNLSNRGTQYVVENILDLLAKNPPRH